MPRRIPALFGWAAADLEAGIGTRLPQQDYDAAQSQPASRLQCSPDAYLVEIRFGFVLVPRSSCLHNLEAAPCTLHLDPPDVRRTHLHPRHCSEEEAHRRTLREHSLVN